MFRRQTAGLSLFHTFDKNTKLLKINIVINVQMEVRQVGESLANTARALV